MILCLGEVLVDLICERPVASLAEADEFKPHFGGALANVAVAARRAGAETGLACGAGDDDWGRWLRDRLAREGVNLDFFELIEGEQTPVAFATFDDAGNPRFQIYGDAVETAVASVRPRLADAIAAADALVYGSTTMATPAEREVTLRARELALARGVPVCFDPNIRPNRWGGSSAPAAQASRAVIEGSFLVRTNREEAMEIAGVDDPRLAAERIVEMGARLVAVTLAEEGAVIRGECEAEEPAREVEFVSSLGAGDAFMGTLVAGLARAGWDPAAAGEVLGPALDAAAEACTRWPALD